MKARGWAVLFGGEIVVHSVSPTELGAKGNFIFLNGVPVRSSDGGAAVEEKWLYVSRLKVATLARVLIETVEF